MLSVPSQDAEAADPEEARPTQDPTTDEGIEEARPTRVIWLPDENGRWVYSLV